MNYILVINGGSSSVKYQLIDMNDESVIAKGIVERIGIEGSRLKHEPAGRDYPIIIDESMVNYEQAIQAILTALTHSEYGVIYNLESIKAIGHRVLHGGEEYCEPVVVTERVIEVIRDHIELGPLHNPANLMGIETCRALLPGKPNVAVFDTAFHQTMPPYAYLYGIPYEMYKNYKVRKYGFHGTSHRYVSRRVHEMLNVAPDADIRLITCHLGNGCSLAAVRGGKCIDTTMGLTPLEGLVMGTRAGDIDAAAIPYLMKKMNLTADEVVNYLNKKSGLLGVSELSNDFRDLKAAAKQGNERAAEAIQMFSYRIKKYIGSYAAAMGGVDVIAFAGGIGENDGETRIKCLQDLDFLGIELDRVRCLEVVGREAVISTPYSRVKVLVVPTNEELMIARYTYHLTYQPSFS